MASCIRGWRPDASGRPTNTGNISVTAFYLLAYSGFLTGADIKCDVGATRESSAGPVVRLCGSSSGASVFRAAPWVILVFLTLPAMKSSQL
jgi:hypothetical protein